MLRIFSGNRWVFCLLVISAFAKARLNRTEKYLVEHLMEGYNALARPMLNRTGPIEIELDFDLQHVEELDAKKETLHTYGWLSLAWEDEYLTWNPEDYRNITTLILPGHKVWRPDIIVRNSAKAIHGEMTDKDDRFFVEVSSAGRVFLSTAGFLVTTCKPDMKFFPFDDQICFIHFDSWTYTSDLLRIVLTDADIRGDYYQESGQWDLKGTSVEVIEDDMYFTVKAYMYLRRKPTYYLYTIMAPCVILSTLVAFVFSLPANAGEKVSFCLTLMLSFSVFLFVITGQMPETSRYIPIFGSFLLIAMTLSALSLLCSLVVLNLHHRDPQHSVPKWVRTLLCLKTSHVDTFTAMSLNRQPDSDSNVVARQGDLSEILRILRGYEAATQADENSSRVREGWAKVAERLDRIFLVLFVLAAVVTTVVLLGIYPLTRPKVFPDSIVS